VKPGDVVIGMLPGAAENKATAASTDCVLLDWQSAGLRAVSCFRMYVLTIHGSDLTVIGHLSEADCTQVRTRVRAALRF